MGWSDPTDCVVRPLTVADLDASFEAFRDEPWPRPPTVILPPWMYDWQAIFWPDYHARYPAVDYFLAYRVWLKTRGPRFGMTYAFAPGWCR